MASRAALVLIAAMQLACGLNFRLPTAQLEPADTCDGTDALRVAMRTGGGFVGPFDLFAQQPGLEFVYLDGHCTFWAAGPHLEARTGTLSSEEWKALADRLGYAHWLQWWGDHGEPVADGGARILWTRSRWDRVEVSLETFCEPANEPAGLCEAFTESRTVAEELAARGAPLAGDVWLAAEPAPGATSGLAWPLADFDLAALAAQSNASRNAQQKFTADQATALRQLRAEAFAGRPDHEREFVVEDANAQRFRVAVRDVLPFENSDGTVALP